MFWALSRTEAFFPVQETIVTYKCWHPVDYKAWRNLIGRLVIETPQVCGACSARWSATLEVMGNNYSPQRRRRNEITSQDYNFRPFFGTFIELNQFFGFCLVSVKTTIHLTVGDWLINVVYDLWIIFALRESLGARLESVRRVVRHRIIILS